MPSTIQQDFDRIALVSEDGATHNDHYHTYLLRHLPARINRALEIGCGTGTFARLLAQRANHVVAIDISSEMIRLARERSTDFPNIDFQLAHVLQHPLESFIGEHSSRHPFSGGHRPPVRVDQTPLSPPSPDTGFDCIASIATLHHLPMEEMLLKMRSALNPGGVLLILDLYQPTGLIDQLRNLLALPVSVTLRLIHHGRLLPRRAERDAWTAHAHHDLYPTMSAVHTLCAKFLPGAKIRKHLLWRYSIVWIKPE